MNELTVYPSWGGQEPRVTVPTPSWMSPPMPEPRWEARSVPPLRVSLLPPASARTFCSVRPPMEPVPSIIPGPPSLPPPPPYPDLRAELAALQAQLLTTADAMTQLRRHILEESEPQLVALACAIGERIAGRELRADPQLVVAWAREAVEQLASDGSVVVAVASDIAATLEDAAWSPVRSASVTIETDAALAAGSCEVRRASSSTDVSLASRAEAVRREVVGAAT